MWGRGNIAYKTEKYDDAIREFKMAIAVNSKNSVVYCFLGMAYVIIGLNN
jgi:anaphase-promoting complex subunit 3